MTRLSPAVRDQLKTVSTATLCTALFKRGLRNQFIQDVRPLNPEGGTMVGEAFTLRYIPAREDLNPITVFQDPEHQFLASTVRAELEVGPRALRRPPREIDAVVDRLLDELGLTALARANPFTLSGGQKRRLSVATVLATSPEVIVLDEPTFGQDRRGWAGIVSLLQAQVADGRAVVAVTHDEDAVRLLGGRHIELAAVKRPPDAAHQPEAVTAHALAARLVPVGRTQPVSRLRHHAGTHISAPGHRHGTIGPPSNTSPSLT